jgi:hypothetical protein
MVHRKKYVFGDLASWKVTKTQLFSKTYRLFILDYSRVSIYFFNLKKKYLKIKKFLEHVQTYRGGGKAVLTMSKQKLRQEPNKQLLSLQEMHIHLESSS